jgi:AmiR/NasT family two-component response regulator
MTATEATAQLHVLVANEVPPALEQLTTIVADLGHVVVSQEVDIEKVGEFTRRHDPDVALVGLGRSSEHALDLISRIVREATCPVIAVLHVQDPAFVRQAAKRGIFAYILDGDADQLQSALEIVLQRFSEFRNLEGAFGRRAEIERAKGILTERHRISENQAFELLRRQSQRSGQKLSDLARAVEQSHPLLHAQQPPAAEGNIRIAEDQA